jgi:hypothetical protein
MRRCPRRRATRWCGRPQSSSARRFRRSEATADLERKRKALDALIAKLGSAVPETDPRLVKARVDELYARLLVLRVGQQAGKGSGTEAPKHIPVEIQGVRIGETVLIGVPVELFVEIGLSVKAASPWKRTWVLGYTNGSMGLPAGSVCRGG